MIKVFLRILLVSTITIVICSQAMAVIIQPTYVTGEERCYGLSVTTYTLNASGNHDGGPIVEAAVAVKTKVLGVLPDGAVKMRLEPLGAVLNGRRLHEPADIGGSTVLKINRYGKVIAIELPSTRFTSARTIDLQHYMSPTWRDKSWIPERDIKQGESWALDTQGSRLKKSTGKVSVTLASESENRQGIDCCRFDMVGSSDVVVGEIISLAQTNLANEIPSGILSKCRGLTDGTSGISTTRNNASCWISPENGQVVAASGRSRTKINVNTGRPLRSKQYELSLENESSLHLLNTDEADDFLASIQRRGQELYHYPALPNNEANNSIGSKIKNLVTNSQRYTTVDIGVSVFDLLLIGCPLNIIDLSLNMNNRLLPDGRNYSNLSLSFGCKVSFSLPVIGFFGLFIGTGFTSGDMEEGIRPGNMSKGISSALLFFGNNLSSSSVEAGLTTSFVKVGMGGSLSLKVINNGKVRSSQGKQDAKASPSKPGLLHRALDRLRGR